MPCTITAILAMNAIWKQAVGLIAGTLDVQFGASSPSGIWKFSFFVQTPSPRGTVILTLVSFTSRRSFPCPIVTVTTVPTGPRICFATSANDLAFTEFPFTAKRISPGRIFALYAGVPLGTPAIKILSCSVSCASVKPTPVTSLAAVDRLLGSVLAGDDANIVSAGRRSAIMVTVCVRCIAALQIFESG